MKDQYVGGVLSWEFNVTSVYIAPELLDPSLLLLLSQTEGLDRIQRVYSIASDRDAYFCGDTLSKEEVAAVKEGPVRYLECFKLDPEFLF